MATLTAGAAQTTGATIQPAKAVRVGLVAVTSFYSVVNSLSISSTIQMVKVAAGCTPLYVAVGATNAGQFTVQVGDGLSVSRYMTEATFSALQGMVTQLPSNYPYTYSADDTIDILVSRVSISTTGGAFYLTAIYSMDIGIGTTDR